MRTPPILSPNLRPAVRRLPAQNRGNLSDGLFFDAVRIRLLEIGEAVKALPDDLLASQPWIPWRRIARMRDHLAHRYFDTAHAILQATIDKDLPDLERAMLALSHSLSDQDDPPPDAANDRVGFPADGPDRWWPSSLVGGHPSV